MRAVVKSLAAAFAMYTRLPVLPVKWDSDSLKYALCSFPATGLVVGLAFILWTWVCGKLGVGDFFRAAVSAAIPLLITGGIHLDGFCDTTDAVFSYKSREERLAIMHDPHIGAFGMMFSVLYLILWTAAMSELRRGYLVFALVFALERSLSGILAHSSPKARRKGTLRTFSDGATVHTSRILAAEAAVITAAMVAADVFAGAAAAVAVVGAFFICRRYALGTFGGVSGDVCGWYLQTAELLALIVIVIVQKVGMICGF